ncbi:hypothetical protein ACFCXC_06320 [Streptomyces microflavus]|uniref:Uncharacterized protein n=1 Tax=Streptomyces microflavus TaxID=1919 RepID=A0A6N9V3L4_STRMI|nr:MULTISPECIES: hypothetical protein [Streptomyces]MBW3360919.1 hypothetical protein [Streptomyces sp. 09ZI22]NEB65828.1 hypothetical protein [Streptomyces microflavus]
MTAGSVALNHLGTQPHTFQAARRLRGQRRIHGDSHGTRTTPPGAVCAIHAGGTARTEQVATTRSCGSATGS